MSNGMFNRHIALLSEGFLCFSMILSVENRQSQNDHSLDEFFYTATLVFKINSYSNTKNVF